MPKHLNLARPLFRSKIAEQELLTGATRSMPSVSLKSLRRGFSEGALIILLLAAAAFLYWPTLYVAGSRMDEATLLVYPELMLQGKIAYRDFETFYPPANLCTLAAAFRVLGIRITTERVVGIMYRLALFAGLYATARAWGKIAAAGVVAIAAFVLMPLWLFANAWIMALALALGSLSLLARSLPLRTGFGTLIAGLLGGFAILFRIDIAPAVVVSGTALLLCLQPGKWRMYALGFILGCAPLLFWVVKAGVGRVIENLFLYPVVYSSPGRRLPLFGEKAEIPFYLCAIVSLRRFLFSLVVQRHHKNEEEPIASCCLPSNVWVCVDFHRFCGALSPSVRRWSRLVTFALLPVLAAATLALKNKSDARPRGGSFDDECRVLMSYGYSRIEPAFSTELPDRLVRSAAPSTWRWAENTLCVELSNADAQSVTRYLPP